MPADLDDLTGSGYSEFFRQWLLLSRREEYIQGSGSHRMWMHIGGSAGHSSLTALDIEEGPAGFPRTWKTALCRTRHRASGSEGPIDPAAACGCHAEFKGGETKTTILATAGVKSDDKSRTIFQAMIDDGTSCHV